MKNYFYPVSITFLIAFNKGKVLEKQQLYIQMQI